MNDTSEMHDTGSEPNGSTDEATTDTTAATTTGATTTGADEAGGSGFDELGLRHELLEALRGLGYEEPTPVQREAIPLMLAGRDLVGQAATGTGKTAAFALPIIERVAQLNERRGNQGVPEPMALVLVPTRELVMQVSEAIYKYGRSSRATVVPVYGGQHIGRQLDALRRGVHVVVATPGRALDHLNRGSLDTAAIEIVVLDEADEMLDMGFAEDLESILDALPDERQTVLFSATMPPRINAIARKHQNDPVTVRIAAAHREEGVAPLVSQRVYVVQRQHNAAALGRILDVEDPGAAIVFCRTRGEVDQLTETLNGRGYRAEALHGGMDQAQRDRVMGRLRSGTAELLVATDVAARGLDVDQLTHVVNYDVPSAPEAYVHRIGRVGRAGRDGVAITLAEPREMRLLANIERLTKQKLDPGKVPTVAELRERQIEQSVETIGASADTELDEYRPILDKLLEDRDLTAVALAAIRLVHDASGGPDDNREIPDASVRPTKGPGGKKAGKQGGKDVGDRGPRRELSATTTTGKVYVGAGKTSKVRPQDLVGAIANETRLTGREIGTIRVSDHYSVVEVPESAVDEVIAAMRTTMLRGKQVTARRYSDDPR
ncbi:DEAD/DEAH box helicase [soil metagenome]